MNDKELMEKIDELAVIRTSFDSAKAIFDEQTEFARERISDLESEIKEEILNRGESIKTEKMSISYIKGRTSWDGKLLEGYALAHPDILQARKIGKPTVSFSMLKK